MPNCCQLSIPNPNTDNLTLFTLIKDAFNIYEHRFCSYSSTYFFT